MTPQMWLGAAISIAVGFAGFLAYKDVSGWGWFLFAALMLSFVFVDTVK